MTARPSAPNRPHLVDDDDSPEPGMDLRALGAQLWPHRARIGRWVAGGGALLLALAFVLPPVYVAEVSMLDAPRPSGNSTLEQLGLSAQMLGIKTGGGGTDPLTYPDILRSRRLLEPLLAADFPTRAGRRVALEGYLVHGPASPQRRERALRLLRKRCDIALDRRTNLLRLAVSDHDPVLAAAVANAAGRSLQDLVTRALMTQAGANRRFVETRLAESRQELTRTEATLETFRETNRHVDDSPHLMLGQARLMREVRAREEVVIALTREYEMARVDENRDVPVINVLDAAQPPAFRSSPRRLAMLAVGLLLGLAIGLARSWPRATNATASEDRAEAA